ncbi:MAG: hypothetical protein JWN37_903 [Candidatus Nomurabacteria bacterium]|nr:hypothetical protein [Candidatus Nomurabacteria bacterium]
MQIDKEFEELWEEIVNDNTWEVIPEDKIERIAQLAGSNEVHYLIHELDKLKDEELTEDSEEASDEYWRRRISVAKILGKVGIEAEDALIKALDSKNDRTREYAAMALGFMQSKKSFVKILELLESTLNIMDKWIYIEALGNLGDQRAVPYLEKYEKTPESIRNKHVVVRPAIEALEKLNKSK